MATDPKQPTPEELQAEQARMQAFAQYQAEKLRVTLAHAYATVQKYGYEAATDALYVLDAFIREFTPLRMQMPPDAQKLLDAAIAAKAAATEVMNRRVVLAPESAVPSPLIR